LVFCQDILLLQSPLHEIIGQIEFSSFFPDLAIPRKPPVSIHWSRDKCTLDTRDDRG